MITVNIIGGLGNQMFQYAFGYAVSKENSTNIRLDLSGFNSYELRDYELGLFNIEENLELKSKYDFFLNRLNVKENTILSKVNCKVLRWLLRLTNFYYQEKEEFSFDKNVFSIKTDTYFYGYWQNEKYFKKYRTELLDIFLLKNVHYKTREYQKQIINSDAVSLHVRRGDYVANKHTNSIHGACGLKYYKKAVREVLKIKKKAHFFIFSDDMDWAKDNLDFIDNKTFIMLESDIPDHEEIHLMSQCKFNIIANSSFSWWGAWLNQNSDKKVIAPKKWFRNFSKDDSGLIPVSWIRL
jgi:hypothetical protein